VVGWREKMTPEIGLWAALEGRHQDSPASLAEKLWSVLKLNESQNQTERI
jgi:hypothetical protein